jgi:predicted nuclease of predicted toxin-antitoxin system
MHAVAKQRSVFEDDEWFQVPYDALPPGPHKKLRLMADANFPRPIAEEIRAAGIDLEGPDAALRGREDAEVLDACRKSGRVLLTFDEGFWNDRKHPLRHTPGVIVLAVPSEDSESALRAFGLVYQAYAKVMPGNSWTGVKVRATPRSMFLKVDGGKAMRWEIRIHRGYAVARELE